MELGLCGIDPENAQEGRRMPGKNRSWESSKDLHIEPAWVALGRTPSLKLQGLNDSSKEYPAVRHENGRMVVGPKLGRKGTAGPGRGISSWGAPPIRAPFKFAA